SGSSNLVSQLEFANAGVNNWLFSSRGAFDAGVNSDRFAIVDAGGSETMTILQSGAIGINNAYPSTTLDVFGTGQVSGSLNVGYTGGSYGGAALRVGDNDFYMHLIDTNTSRISFGSNDYLQYNRATDYFNFAIAGTTRLSILQSGNIGIGTSTPSSRLDINGGAANTEQQNNVDTGFVFSTKYKHGGVTQWNFSSRANAESNRFGFFNSASTEVMTFVQNGNIGIGTFAPAVKLDVVGDANVSGTVTANVFKVGTAGAASFGDPNYYAQVSGGNAVLAFGSDDYTLFERATNSQRWVINAVETMRLTNNGDLGIGISVPAQKLQVYGDIRVGTSGTNGCLQNFAGGALAGTCSSDRNYKKEIYSLKTSLDLFNQLRPVSYTWRVDEFPNKHFGEGKNIGLIAQEVEKIFPDLVSTDEDGYKRIRYGVELQMLSIQAIKDLSKRVEVKDSKIKAQQLALDSIRKLQKTQELRLQMLENKLNFLMQNILND
ncbi:tail fiber domain-containing protein, partial [bacterium]|nr:tail fiber domain-containing protein [bacterium]